MNLSEPFLLSTKGSTRASAYGFSNKSVRLGDTTHVVWLDAVAQVCSRSLSHASGEWSETRYLFEGCDNHTSPTLSVDRGGHLHMAYGPHGIWGGWNKGQFRWVRSEEPNRSDAWVDEQSFGYSATYACMTHTPHDLDVIVYRGGEAPASLMLQKQRPAGGWSSAREIMRQDILPQYTHYNATVVSDSEGALYVAGHFYNVGGAHNPIKGPRDKMRSYGIAILKSTDLGETWTGMGGSPAATPALNNEEICIPPHRCNMYLEGLCVDSHNTLWALTGGRGECFGDLTLLRWSGSAWESTDLAPVIPDGYKIHDSVLSIDTRDRIHVAAAGPKCSVGEDKAWDHSSNEVFHLVSDATQDNFACNMVSTPDETTANWLPNISRPGPFNPVENPVILYTHGHKGDGCSPTTETDVYCVFVEEPG